MGGVRENEDWTLRIDTGEYSPWLGDSYQSVRAHRAGIPAFTERRPRERATRSRRSRTTSVCRRWSTMRRAPRRPASSTASTPRFPDCSTRFVVPRQPALPPCCPQSTSRYARRSRRSRCGIRRRPYRRWRAGSQPHGTAIEKLSAEPDAVFILKVKEQQFEDAINTALGVDLQAVAAVGGPVDSGPACRCGRIADERCVDPDPELQRLSLLSRKAGTRAVSSVADIALRRGASAGSP